MFILIIVIWGGAVTGSRMASNAVCLRQYIQPLPGFSSHFSIQDRCPLVEHPQENLCGSTGMSCERQMAQSSSVIGTTDAEFIFVIFSGIIPLKTTLFNFLFLQNRIK